MTIKDKLQVYLVTYNRKEKLQYTLDEILKSPIRDFDITVLDNASTDGTSELIDDYCAKYPNLKHIRHNVNIGGNANICRAFEMSASCGKEYAWILCDDDKYDFSNWSQVEEYINQGKDIICVSDYIFPTEKDKSDKAYQIFQLTFVPANIFKTKNITDGVLINMYDAILTMFQQSCLTIHIINNNGEIVVLDKPIVHNGLHFEDRVDDESLAFTRGADDEKEIIGRRKDGVWALGFSSVITMLKDKSLQKHCFEVAIPYKDIHQSWNRFYKFSYYAFFKPSKFNYFCEFYNALPFRRKLELLLYSIVVIFDKILINIFSIKNSNDKKFKIIRILGIRIYVPRDKFKKKR